MDRRREEPLGRKILTLDGREGHSRQQTPSNRNALNRPCSQQAEGAASARRYLLGAKKDNGYVPGGAVHNQLQPPWPSFFSNH